MDIGDWLRSLSLERYEAAFSENEIDETVLPTVTADDLKDLGVDVVGHRRKLLNAISVLRTRHRHGTGGYRCGGRDIRRRAEYRRAGTGPGRAGFGRSNGASAASSRGPVRRRGARQP
jgi:hypothetical protein